MTSSTITALAAIGLLAGVALLWRCAGRRDRIHESLRDAERRQWAKGQEDLPYWPLESEREARARQQQGGCPCRG